MNESDQIVYVVDDDEGIREGLSLLLESVGQKCELFASALEFLEVFDRASGGCLVLDIRMPRMTGLELQARLQELNSQIPIIFITGHGDIPMAVEAMRRGALDFIPKPFREQELLERINQALAQDCQNEQRRIDSRRALEGIDSMTPREREVFDLVSEGQMNKVIALELGISERTVEVHRSQAMKKLGVRTLAQMVRAKIDAENAGVRLTPR